MTTPPAPLRLAFVDHAPVLGGAETSLLTIVTHLDRSRCDPLVLVPAASPLVPLLEARRIPWHELALPRLTPSPRSAARWYATARRLARLVGEHHIDVIHTNTARAHLVGALVPTTPVVWMVRDDTLPRWLFALLQRRPAALVANSWWTARRYGLGEDARTTVVHPGVEVDVVPSDGAGLRRRLGIEPGDLLVAQVGRLVRWKGHETFLRAAARIARALPAARFAVVGGTSEEDAGRGGGAAYARELERAAAALGLAGRCVFTGHQAAMRDVYAGIDLLVHCPTRPEPFGRALVEAMAAGVPVVAADDGGPREIVEQGVTGLLVSPGTAEPLAAVVIDLLEDAPRRRAMGRAGRRRARECFDACRQTDLLAVLSERIGRERRS